MQPDVLCRQRIRAFFNHFFLESPCCLCHDASFAGYACVACFA
jgi:hypothetical protein